MRFVNWIVGLFVAACVPIMILHVILVHIVAGGEKADNVGLWYSKLLDRTFAWLDNLGETH